MPQVSAPQSLRDGPETPRSRRTREDLGALTFYDPSAQRSERSPVRERFERSPSFTGFESVDEGEDEEPVRRLRQMKGPWNPNRGRDSRR